MFFKWGWKIMSDLLPHIYFGPDILSKFDHAIRFEWILTNGLGGYASSTILNVNTRKFHGLLFIAFNPPVNRHLLLSKVDEEILINGERYPLGSNQFKDAIYPEGYRNLKGFEMQPFPTFHYQIESVYLKKEIFMPYRKNMVVMVYDVFNGLKENVKLRIYPLITIRHFYETSKKGDFQVSREKNLGEILFEFSPKKGFLLISSTAGSYVDHRDIWIERIYFRRDDSRGESCFDDCLQPGFFSVDLKVNERTRLYLMAFGGVTKESVLSTYSRFGRKEALDKLFFDEKMRWERILERFYRGKKWIKREDWLSWLLLAADSFVVWRRETGRKSIIAGYHWFEDWGRDALISLSGLTLVTGRFRDAEEILLTFAEHCEDGLMPNRFPDKLGGEPEYGSVDASLWFFNAVFQYLKYTGNFNFVYDSLWDVMQNICEHYIHGTKFGIRMDKDALIIHGSRLTWMDAAVNGVPVTPRGGKAVEIQALWYNALRIMEILSLKFHSKSQAETYHELALLAKKSFNEKFWNGKYLYDVICNGHGDSSLRPNQIIAIHLDFPILENSKMESVVETVQSKLLTPYGLRSLAPDDPRYIGVYSGNFSLRDSAYHNGTVWPWLLGPFTTAFLKTRGYTDYWRRFALERFLEPLFRIEPYRAGLGSLSEIFDGDPPHSPRGCISQAWSVAEPFRAYVEDILLERAPFEKKVFHEEKSNILDA